MDTSTDSQSVTEQHSSIPGTYWIIINYDCKIQLSIISFWMLIPHSLCIGTINIITIAVLSALLLIMGVLCCVSILVMVTCVRVRILKPEHVGFRAMEQVSTKDLIITSYLKIRGKEKHLIIIMNGHIG